MVARNLQTWSPPEGMAKSLQNAQQTVEFDLVYGYSEYGASILDHIKTNTRQGKSHQGSFLTTIANVRAAGLREVYMLALAEPTACGIIRAKRPEDGSIIGTVILYNMKSNLAEFVPAMRHFNEPTGAISSPVISPSVGEYSTLLQSLVLLGMRQIKQQGCNACLLDYVSGPQTFRSIKNMY